MEEINRIIETDLNEIGIQDFAIFHYLYRMINIILKENLPRKEKKYKKKIPLKKNIEYTSMFLDYLNPSYREHFMKALENNRIEFEKNYEANDRIACSDIRNHESYIYIPYENTLKDTYTITHEVIHDISIAEEISEARNFFCEVFSLLSEKLQKDYIKRYVACKENNINEINILYYLRLKTICTKFELDLVAEYLNKGYLTEMDIINLIVCSGNENVKLLCDHVNYILDKKELLLFIEQRYMVGYLIACYMHDRILDDPKKKLEFIELNDNINEYTESDFLEYLDLGFSDDYYFNFNEDTYKKLEKAYHHEIKRIG